MPDPEPSGVSVSAGGDITAGGDIVGRDKIIHNLIVVGQVLDFAQIEGLLPKLNQDTDFKTIGAAFEATFNQRLGADLATATSLAGELLAPALAAWAPARPQQALPYKQILVSLAQPLAERLLEFGYWSSFAEPVTEFNWTVFSGRDPVEVVWLRSLATLWKKYKNEDKLYGLAVRRSGDKTDAVFIYQGLGGRATEAYEPLKPGKPQTDFAKLGRQEFRIFMVGLVIDLIRLASTAANDALFWNQLTQALTGPEKQ